MAARWHEGEIAVQTRAGVRASAEKIGGGIHAAIPPGAQEFLAERRTAVLGAADRDGRVWASPLEGPPGFLAVLDAHTLGVGAFPHPDDPLAASLRSGDAVGLVILDATTRRRMRCNGVAEVPGDGTLRVRATEVFANCPKYIQRRVLVDAVPPSRVAARRGTTLDAGQIARIRAADTLFIASRHAAAGADASHRGGEPGFVHVLDDGRLAWGDYPGNRMFQTLGNLHADPRAGLLFPGFEDGTTLQVSGRARILWEPAQQFPGAERRVELAVEAVVEVPGASGLRWRLLDRSPHNPPA